jgi:pimeloyl-ACP methyl ester carboxylesterase
MLGTSNVVDMKIVFVHGAFVRDGAWWWAPTADLLRGSGVESQALALPSCGETGVAPTGGGPDLHADAAALRGVLDSGGPAVVVAHSYGGMVASEGAADHPDVAHLLYISSFLPSVGESLAVLTTNVRNPPLVAPRPDGSVEITDPDLDARVLHDVTDPDVVAGAHARLVPQAAAVFGQPVTAAAWTTTPSTYLVCTDDRNTPHDLQRAHAARAGRSIELDIGHHPFISRPGDVASIILSTLARFLE